MIGEYKKCFVIKYAIIYEDEEKRNTHLQSVLNNLNNYLNNVQFYENNAPIIDENYNILGTIILSYFEVNDLFFYIIFTKLKQILLL